MSKEIHCFSVDTPTGSLVVEVIPNGGISMELYSFYDYAGTPMDVAAARKIAAAFSLAADIAESGKEQEPPQGGIERITRETEEWFNSDEGQETIRQSLENTGKAVAILQEKRRITEEE